jgi:hypothetical protein
VDCIPLSCDSLIHLFIVNSYHKDFFIHGTEGKSAVVDCVVFKLILLLYFGHFLV